MCLLEADKNALSDNMFSIKETKFIFLIYP